MSKSFALLLACLLVIAPGARAAALPDTVRIAAHGTRYHSIGCPALRLGSRLVYRASADSAGMVPCKRCIAAPPRKAVRVVRGVR